MSECAELRTQEPSHVGTIWRCIDLAFVQHAGRKISPSVSLAAFKFGNGNLAMREDSLEAFFKEQPYG